MPAIPAAVSRPMVIAIDGPAASGKGTIARLIAQHYGLAALDTGLLYRAVGQALIGKGIDPHDAAAAEAAARTLEADRLDDPALRSEAAGEAASIVAAMPGVRAALLDFQRNFARQGAVLDGRDIGTVVCPDADVKLYVTADRETRARRRHRELSERGASIDYEQVLADIARRDQRDSARATAPLRPADDSHLLDTSDLDIETALARAIAIIDAARAI